MKNQTHLRKKITALAMTAILTCSIYGCTAKKSESTAASLDPDNPVTVTIWNYYNGDQLALFEQLVEEFNSTVGTEKGVTVTSVSLGNVDTLADSLLDSVNEKAGSEDTPTLASVYSETAYILDKEDALVSFDDYFTVLFILKQLIFWTRKMHWSHLTIILQKMNYPLMFRDLLKRVDSTKTMTCCFSLC